MAGNRVGAFTVHRVPLRQLMTIDGLDAVSPGHRTTGLVEFDVTTAVRRLDALRAAGRRVTLVSFVVSCIGKALSEHPALNSIRTGRRVYRFEDVDVSLALEIVTPQGSYPHQVTIRRAQDKDAEAIYAEIEAARQRHGSGGGASVEDRRFERAVRWLSRTPRFVRIGVLRAVTRSPRRVKRWAGTTFVTSVTKFADSGGFVIPYAAGPVAVSSALGGLVRRHSCVDGGHETREHLCVTIIVNHDLVDGAPAARFVQRLQQLIETAHGLEDSEQSRPGNRVES